MQSFTRFAFLCAATLVSAGTVASAANVSFTIDPAQSSLTMTPSTVAFLPNKFAKQVNPLNTSADSYVTSYSGTLEADVTSSTFQLLSTSVINADEVNNWTPGTNWSGYVPNQPGPDGYIDVAAPAAYGTIQDFTGSGFGNNGLAAIAIRNLAVRLSHAAAKTITGNTFSDAGATSSLVYDAPYEPLIYYSAGGAGKSGGPTTDADTVFPAMFDAAGDASLVTVGNVMTLTLPVGFNIPASVYNYRFEGTIVATAVVPEPASLGALALVGVFGLSRRNRKVAG